MTTREVKVTGANKHGMKLRGEKKVYSKDKGREARKKELRHGDRRVSEGPAEGCVVKIGTGLPSFLPLCLRFSLNCTVYTASTAVPRRSLYERGVSDGPL